MRSFGRWKPHRSCATHRRPPHRKPLHVQAIGFHFGDDNEPGEKAKAPAPKLSTLTTLASSLLIFGSVLKGAVGEAFLGTLSMATKYQASNKVIRNLIIECMHDASTGTVCTVVLMNAVHEIFHRMFLQPMPSSTVFCSKQALVRGKNT